jgi:uncharacterized protein YqhQ
MADIQIGGQAIIEGVLMRGESAYAMAVRLPNGTIETKRIPSIPWTKRHWLLGLPIIRGPVMLIETMIIGFQAIEYSANQSLAEGEGKISAGEFSFSLLLSLVLSIGLFVALPAFVFTLLKNTIPNLYLLNLIEGSIRISVFICYLLFMTRMPELRRVFEYHGAEHKAIHQLLENNDLSSVIPENVAKQSRIHASCGTSFLFIVLLVSIFIFSFLGRPDLLTRIIMKILLMPLVAGVAYEIIRIARKKNAPFWSKMLVIPGKWFQLLTTREPDQKQIEVAIAALKTAL